MNFEDLPIAPVVILARPQMGENIGAAARAMMNCGLTELRLVNPRDGWPNPAALPMAAGGGEIIKNAQVLPSVAAAAHDVTLLLAASARRRDLSIKSTDPRGAASLMLAHDRQQRLGDDSQTVSAINAKQGRVAMMFGPEASGLDNDEVVLADLLVTAPLNPAYPSLNLAQAVLLFAWEWRMAAQLDIGQVDALVSPVISNDHSKLASISEREIFFGRLEAALDDGGFFTAPEMATSVKRNLRAFFTRGAPTGQEINTLHGVIQALSRRRD